MKNTILILFIFSCISCRTNQLKMLDLAKPVDTSTRDIAYQKKKKYTIKNLGITIDNLFDGARINGINYSFGDTIEVTILPENKPINQSPWYAFRIRSEESQKIVLRMYYDDSDHRYDPKLSYDGLSWSALDTTAIDISPDKKVAFFSINLKKDQEIWVSAQELQNSTHVAQWIDRQCIHDEVSCISAGKSALGRDIPGFLIGQHDDKKKETIVILSRQHPPEVTGYLAMQSFVEEITAKNILSDAFRKKYNVLVFPLVNPDGVDLGHWRHNTGGVDLNRDWAYYRQPETKAVANYIINFCKKNKSNVVLGIDFHSTYHDVYYSLKESAETSLPLFKDYWLYSIDQAMPNYTPNDRPGKSQSPVSKSWFFHQFGAEGITYEIGDDTPRSLIKRKGSIDAQEMMQLLIMR